MYTNDQKIRNDTVKQIPYRRFKKTSRITSNKIKKRWVEKAKLSGMILDKRTVTKHTKHWIPKSRQAQSR
jgi:hypothetical protein